MALSFSCTTDKKLAVKGPITNHSQINELRLVIWHYPDDPDLHITGQVFIADSLNVKDSLPKKACVGCAIEFHKEDEKVMSKQMKTDTSGKFFYQGPNGFYSIELKNLTQNHIIIRKFDFKYGGTFNLILENAVGNLSEDFTVTVNEEHKFSWTYQQNKP